MVGNLNGPLNEDPGTQPFSLHLQHGLFYLVNVATLPPRDNHLRPTGQERVPAAAQRDGDVPEAGVLTGARPHKPRGCFSPTEVAQSLELAEHPVSD